MNACQHPPARTSAIFPARDYVTEEMFEIRRCGDCGLALTWPPPPPERLGDYYPAAYYAAGESNRFPKVVEAGQARLYDWRARAVERVCGSAEPGTPRRVLDIGCGRGHLLSAFQRRGWKVMGTELSEQSAKYPREVAGLDIKVGSLPALQLPAGQFDAVTMWQVLEHVPDPHAFIAEVHRLLKPGGVFFVSVPNFASPEARATGAGWFHLDVPRHLVHFTPETLRSALEAGGFAQVGDSWFAPEYDLFSIVQSTLNRLGLRQNLLYELLRTRGAKLLRSKANGAAEAGGRWQALATLALAAPLGLLGLPSTIVASLAKRGAIMTVLARKA
jgi:SAM-dependent methyltransferase